MATMSDIDLEDLARFLAETCPECGTPGPQRHLSTVNRCGTCTANDPRPACVPVRNVLGGRNARSEESRFPDGSIILTYDMVLPLLPAPLAAGLFRDRIANPQPQPRYVPPPLADGHVRVEIDRDYYTGEEFSEWTDADARYPARVFEVRREQYDRWVAVRAAYYAMQEEIETMREERSRTPGFAPEGWVRKP
jgi:hypothetical protein